jgi:outer membrane lipoprotein SlyB
MRKMLGIFAATGILGAAALAGAAEPVYTATGTIKSIDMLKHVVTLDDGSTYKVARGVNISAMKAGQKVRLTYTGSGSTIEASAIAPGVD